MHVCAIYTYPILPQPALQQMPLPPGNLEAIHKRKALHGQVRDRDRDRSSARASYVLVLIQVMCVYMPCRK